MLFWEVNSFMISIGLISFVALRWFWSSREPIATCWRLIELVTIVDVFNWRPCNHSEEEQTKIYDLTHRVCQVDCFAFGSVCMFWDVRFNTIANELQMMLENSENGASKKNVDSFVFTSQSPMYRCLIEKLAESCGREYELQEARYGFWMFFGLHKRKY